jgi:hypothetical protein
LFAIELPTKNYVDTGLSKKIGTDEFNVLSQNNQAYINTNYPSANPTAIIDGMVVPKVQATVADMRKTGAPTFIAMTGVIPSVSFANGTVYSYTVNVPNDGSKYEITMQASPFPETAGTKGWVQYRTAETGGNFITCLFATDNQVPSSCTIPLGTDRKLEARFNRTAGTGNINMYAGMTSYKKIL